MDLTNLTKQKFCFVILLDTVYTTMLLNLLEHKRPTTWIQFYITLHFTHHILMLGPKEIKMDVRLLGKYTSSILSLAIVFDRYLNNEQSFKKNHIQKI